MSERAKAAREANIIPARARHAGRRGLAEERVTSRIRNLVLVEVESEEPDLRRVVHQHPKAVPLQYLRAHDARVVARCPG